MTYFLLRNHNLLPKNELHLSLWVSSLQGWAESKNPPATVARARDPWKLSRFSYHQLPKPWIFVGALQFHLDLQKEPKIVALYPKIESVGSTGSIILAILEVQSPSRPTFWVAVKEFD